MAKKIVELAKINHKGVMDGIIADTYKDIPLKCGSKVLFPTRIGPNLQEWLDKIHKEQEIRKQA